MSYFSNAVFNPNQLSLDAASRVRVGQLTTRGDYKILNADRQLLWESAGTGTGTFSDNMFNMSVLSGQWYIRNSRRIHPYLSGKSQQVEWTFDKFGAQANVIKRFGYYSSVLTTPFATTFDGFWLENTGSSITLNVSNAGTPTLDALDIASWSGYSQLGEYQSITSWDNFTVVLFDFLWLGGAILRVWVRTSAGFILAHQFDYPGTARGVMMKSPNHPIRAEIRSSTGTGEFRPICAQVSTEGSIENLGLTRSVDTGTTAIAVNSIGTKYPVLSIKKGTNYRDIDVQLIDATILIGTADNLRWSMEINPTMSAPLSYSAVPNSAVEYALGNGTITVTSPGTVLASGYLSEAIPFPNGIFKETILAHLSSPLTGAGDEFTLCLTPITSNISSFSSLIYKEF